VLGGAGRTTRTPRVAVFELPANNLTVVFRRWFKNFEQKKAETPMYLIADGGGSAD